MQLGKTLIDKAALMCGSYSELARQTGTSPAALSHMKHGTREISPETAAILADIAQEDPAQAAIDAIIERNKNGPKAERIRAILGKGRAGGAAAVLLLCLTAPTAYAIANVADKLTMLHIVLSRLCALLTGGVGVPEPQKIVNGEGSAAVLTRSLRFASGCGFRAAH